MTKHPSAAQSYTDGLSAVTETKAFFHACRTTSRRHRHNRDRRRRLFLLEPAAVPSAAARSGVGQMAGSRSSGWISPPSLRAASPRSRPRRQLGAGRRYRGAHGCHRVTGPTARGESRHPVSHRSHRQGRSRSGDPRGGATAFRGRTAPCLALERRAAVSPPRSIGARRNEIVAQILGAKADVRDAIAAREAAEAHVAHIEAIIVDMTLKTPVSGRVEYRLARAGEVLAAGGRVITSST